MRRGILIASLWACASAPAWAQAELEPRFDNARGYRECAGFTARIDDPPAGARILRAEPNDRGARVGRYAIANARGPIPFTVHGSDDGWLQVRVNGTSGADAWLLGWGVSTGVNATLGYAHPRSTGSIVIRTRDGTRLDQHAELIDIIGCDGSWIFGRWRVDDPAGLTSTSELEVWTDPPVIEFWTPVCDRRSLGCDTPPNSRPARRGPRDPIHGRVE